MRAPSSPWSYAAASGGITDTADVAVKAAAGAGLRNFIRSIQLHNKDGSVGTEVVIKDGASTVIWRGYAPAVQITGVGFVFDPPIPGTANTALNVACITTSSETYVNAQGFVAP